MNDRAFRLVSFEVNGIKNISKPISIQFLNQMIKKDDFENSQIKIIYGPNGSGKTAVVTALSFYKRITCDPNAMNNPLFNHGFYTLVNKNADSVFFTVVFAINASPKSTLKLKHMIRFDVDKGKGSVRIAEESISRLDSRNNETKLFEVKDNKLTFTPYDYLNGLMINRLDNVSIVARMTTLIENSLSENGKFKDGVIYLVSTFFFARSMFIYFGSDENVVYHPYIIPKPEDASNAEKIVNDMQEMDKDIDKRYLTSVRYEDIEEYEKHIDCVKKFVQLFKPELNNIGIDKRDLNGKYWINLTFIYEDGSRVDFENESTGIKKIVTLSNAFEALSQGGIAVIDEIDTGIMDKIITEMVDYACKYTDGQLILTTHHVGLMDVVKKEKHSIDFLSCDNVLTRWIKNGRYNPEKVFLNGGIPHIPLNINSPDFVDVFNFDH